LTSSELEVTGSLQPTGIRVQRAVTPAKWPYGSSNFSGQAIG